MPLDSADLSRLRTLPLLATASEDSFDRLTRDAVSQYAPRRIALTTEGEISAHLPILVQGAVALEGQGATLALLEAPATVMLASVVLDVPALVTAWVAPRSRALLIPGQALREAARSDSALAFAVAEELSGCYSGVVRSFKNQRLRGTLERLANYLLALHRRQGGERRLKLPHRKRVLASLLGMTPENLSRGFASLASLGVEVDGPTVVLQDPAALAALASPDGAIDNHAAFDGDHPGQAERERRRAQAFHFPVTEDARP
jgi:CRP/FNR family transcriptional activator FtrB